MDGNVMDGGLEQLTNRIMIHTKTGVQQLAPGITLDRMQPGGRRGPNDYVLSEVPGGLVWNDFFTLGEESDPFQVTVPDIRMPANQYWPLHWHGCWIAVVIIEGSCVIGDWWMKQGDVLISAANVEYGPLVVGPSGCQLFEIFAKAHLQGGGYGPEYHDHFTLKKVGMNFEKRFGVNTRNNGNSTLPMGSVDGLIKGRLEPGNQWDLGESNDPERCIMKDTRLRDGEKIAPHSYGDWHTFILLDGSMRAGNKVLTRNDVLVIRPNSPVPEIEGGRDGVQLLEVSRTWQGSERRPVAQ